MSKDIDDEKIRTSVLNVEEGEHPLEAFARQIKEDLGGEWEDAALIPILVVYDFHGNEKMLIHGDPGDIATITVRERVTLEPGDYVMIGFLNPELESKTDG